MGRTRCSMPARCRSMSAIRVPTRPTKSRPLRRTRRSSGCIPEALNRSDRAIRQPSDPDVPSPPPRALATSRTAFYEFHLVRDQDWVRATQAQFGTVPHRPSTCGSFRRGASRRDARAINLTLDPGLAFGTGSIRATQLCLRWLATQLRPGADLLDYGCGSGILAIAAVKLGAAHSRRHRRRRASDRREHARTQGATVSPRAFCPSTIWLIHRWRTSMSWWRISLPIRSFCSRRH